MLKINLPREIMHLLWVHCIVAMGTIGICVSNLSCRLLRRRHRLGGCCCSRRRLQSAALLLWRLHRGILVVPWHGSILGGVSCLSMSMDR